jgi:hypothetical protein
MLVTACLQADAQRNISQRREQPRILRPEDFGFDGG